MTPALWAPTPEWEGGDAYLIGGGPSLKDFDFSVLAGRNVIGCNDAWHLGSHIVGICLFGDPGWWHRNKWDLQKEFTGRLVTNAPGIRPFEVPGLLKMDRIRDGLHGGSTLGWNYSTGAAAINLAITLGAQQIYLLGYDMGSLPGASHWHNYNPKMIQDMAHQRHLRGFQCVKRCLPPGIRVLNVTDGTSRLNCFEKISPTAFLESLKLQEVAA